MKARSLMILILLLGVALTLLTSRTLIGSASVVLEKRYVHSAALHVITADLNSPRIRVEIGLAAKGIPHSETFSSMVHRLSPLAAVTGTYFDTRTLFPVGSIVISGKPAHESAIGTAVCFVKQEAIVCSSDKALAPGPRAGGYVVRIVRTSKGESFNWRGVETGFRAGPLLLQNGLYALNPGREGFRHPGLFGRRTRMAMGLTSHNKLLLVTVETPVTFGGLAGIMKSLGAVDALALDGGASSAMYFGGRIVRYPGRALTNIIAVFENSLPPAARIAVYPTGGPVRPLTVWAATRPAMAQTIGPAVTLTAHRRSSFSILLMALTLPRNAILPEPSQSGFAKGRGALFPIHRAEFPGLKRLNHPDYLVHIAADIQVMHHLVA